MRGAEQHTGGDPLYVAEAAALRRSSMSGEMVVRPCRRDHAVGGSVTDSNDRREIEPSHPTRCLARACRMIDLVELVVTSPDRRIRGHLKPTRIAIVTGVVFFLAGLVKFAFHHWELHAFRSFGLPWSSASEIVAGVVETIGGALLVARRGVVPVTVVLAVTMLVAIIASGIGHGDVIPSLTLAPALLLAVLYLFARAMPLGPIGHADRSEPAHHPRGPAAR
jgi:uncharacterized membrane protein YphA (DoxX/SURF4 family)